MKLSVRSQSLRSSAGLFSVLALVACGQPESAELAQENLPEPIFVTPSDADRTAQAVDPTQLARIRADLLIAVNNARKVARKCGGKSPFDRMKAAGYSFSYAGENIAAGNSTVAATMTQWLTSAGHCANIMNKNFTEIGFGYDNSATSSYKHYWVQNFGKPR